MEFHIPKSLHNQSFKESFNFSPEDLADIPCPDDICAQAENSPVEDNAELLLPPGTSPDHFSDLPLPPGTSPDFSIPLPPKPESLNISNNFCPSLPHNKDFENTLNSAILKSKEFDILSLEEKNQLKADLKTNEFQEDISGKVAEFLDDGRYSPSKMDSDEENQNFITIKPKVLGKEQAKKRLLAFSLSKQPSASVKKQNKAITPAKNKEKPPNPNKSTNVQEQLRATITAIEEEKKKMFQNMPSYLLLEMSELAKTHSSMSSSLELLEKLRSENIHSKTKGNYGKDGNSSTKSSDRKSRRSFYKSRSQSKSKKVRRSRSRTKRSHSRRRRSHSRSHSKRCRETHYKSDKISRESQSVPKKKFEDWKSFKVAGQFLKNESEVPKNCCVELKFPREEYCKRSRSPKDRTDSKSVPNSSDRSCSLMTFFQARSTDSSTSAPVLFLEKAVKYTKTRPAICWSESKTRASESCLSKQMLLENCDETTSSILLSIIENKTTTLLEGDKPSQSISEALVTKSRLWYPRDGLMPTLLKSHKDLKAPLSHLFGRVAETADENEIEEVDTEDSTKGRLSLERKISLVNDSYLSDEEEKEMVVGEVKLQLDLDMNRVKVRSKWDSDYEEEHSEKESNFSEKERQKPIDIKVQPQPKNQMIEHSGVSPYSGTVQHTTENNKSVLNISSVQAPSAESPILDSSSGKLVSEYEEFLKMVSVDSSDIHDNQKKKITAESQPETENLKTKKVEKCSERSPKLIGTDWDQESDNEDISLCKKMQFTNTEHHDEFLLLRKKESFDIKMDRNNKRTPTKNTERLKSTKKKLLKKSKKTKKNEAEVLYSEYESSIDSYESDSESDSDESDSSQKEKKKSSKTKKKSKKDSISESDNDSDDSKTREKKSTKKKGKKKQSSSSDDNSEVPAALLKKLDLKKQLVMTKVEKIDYISDKSGKKKEKEKRKKKKGKESSGESDSDKYIESEKKKKTDTKVEKDKKKFKLSSKKWKLSMKSKFLKKSKSSSESESDSESSDESVKKKKAKKSGKRKRYSTESSDSEKKREKGKSNSNKTSKKRKITKRRSKSTESYDSDGNSKEKVKIGNEKLDKTSESSVKSSVLLDEADIKHEKHWEMKKMWKNPEEKSIVAKEDDDWEASSSFQESEQENRTRESSWNEETESREIKSSAFEDSKSEKIKKSQIVLVKEINYSTDTSETNQLASETLKTSLSNFSFNENSFCSFGQELSRDFFLAERSYSNSGNLLNSESLRTTLIDPRPFQSVSKNAECKKPSDSERYSPGYSDSEFSDLEMKCEKVNSVSNAGSGTREDVYDPLNCESEGSADNNDIELSSIPLPHAPDILLPEMKNFENIDLVASSSESSALKNLPRKEEIPAVVFPCMTSPVKFSFTSSDFTPVITTQSIFKEEKNTPTKRQLMSVKGQQKLVSKAASVFQDESDEENIEPNFKGKEIAQAFEGLKQKTDETKSKKEEKRCRGEKYIKALKKETCDGSRERSKEREGRRRRSRSRESRDDNKISRKTSPNKRRKSRTPEPNRGKREIRSDSFEIESLKSSIDSNRLNNMVQQIPVLTGLEAPSTERLWSRSLISGCEYLQATHNLINHAESFDIYPPEESIRKRNCSKDYADYEKSSTDKSKDQKIKNERRKSRSRSYSPRKKIRSKSPERRKSPRNRSPRRKSASPKRRDKSPFSPRRRSPKRKSPSRRYKSHKKSHSRSPRKRRGSSSRRSRSVSPRKYRSPKRRDESPKKTQSPRDRFSPRKDVRYSQLYSNCLHNRIPVIGDCDTELSPSAMPSPYQGPVCFHRRMPDSSVVEPEIYSSFYEGEYTDEFGMSSYSEDVGVNNLITVKNHDIEKANSPERLSLDQRIELELGVQMSVSQTGTDQYRMQNQVCPPFQEIHFQNSYNCDNSNDNFYQNVQMNADFNRQYFNGHHQAPSGYGSFQQFSNSQPVQNSVLQVGNIVEVVPTLQHPPPPPPPPSKAPQIMQVGNVLQVVPSQKATPLVPPQKTQKATAVVAPSSVVPPPNPEAVLNPLIKAIQLEREKKKKEKEKRKTEREARRKARQLRREAKLMSINEKLKKSVQNEGLMLGQEVEDDELLDGLDVPSPPIPVEIITVSSVSALPPAGKGILITAGFMPKPPSEKKEVKFADGVCPGEGTSTSGDDDIASPPPKPKLPKEKRFKKKKTKMKKKVKVQIIRQIIEDDEEDDLSPPPPPPGDPPLVFFARFPFAGDAQFPVYQTQTTTTTLTTVQYPAQTFE